MLGIRELNHVNNPNLLTSSERSRRAREVQQRPTSQFIPGRSPAVTAGQGFGEPFDAVEPTFDVVVWDNDHEERMGEDFATLGIAQTELEKRAQGLANLGAQGARIIAVEADGTTRTIVSYNYTNASVTPVEPATPQSGAYYPRAKEGLLAKITDTEDGLLSHDGLNVGTVNKLLMLSKLRRAVALLPDGFVYDGPGGATMDAVLGAAPAKPEPLPRPWAGCEPVEFTPDELTDDDIPF